VLISILPIRLLPKIRPVAAASYFLRNSWLAWFSRNIIGIIPVRYGKGLGRHRVLNEAISALKHGDILIIYPEGTRGKPEKLQEFKRGIAVLTTVLPDVPVHPVYIYGLGKVLPKGEILPVPFVCSVVVGNPINKSRSCGSKVMQQLKESMEKLAHQGRFPAWE
jgi:1-acyl-sn-glycerol-3-phosphate acyltransferase